MEGLKPPKWLSKENYDHLKPDYVSRVKEKAFSYLDSNQYTKDFSRDKKEIAATLMSRFQWGAKVAAMVYGYENDFPEIDWRPEPQLNYVGIEWSSADKTSFVFNSINLEKLLERLLDKKDKITFWEPPFIRGVKSEDNFELSGVEEMAHLFFHDAKKHFGGSKILGSGHESLDYRSSDLESRAILWKTLYTKRYMPHYRRMFHRFYHKIRRYREKGGRG